jgi:hypothetical protein
MCTGRGVGGLHSIALERIASIDGQHLYHHIFIYMSIFT